MREILKARLRSVFEEILDELVGRLTNALVSRCIECDAPTDHFHHPIPRSLGGSATIPVCHACHGTIHGIDFTNHSELVKVGLEKARTGKNRLHTPEKIAQIRAAIERGLTTQAIVKIFRCSDKTITRIRRGKL